MKQNIIMITDPNKDTDDLTALIMLSNLQKDKKVNIAGVVTTHGDDQTTFLRAMYSCGVFNLLNNSTSICAGVGLNLQNEIMQKSSNKFYFNGKSEEVMSYAVKDNICTDSLIYLKDIFSKAKNKSLDLLIVAQLTDIAKFIKFEPKLFIKKIKTITIMGGFNTTKEEYLTPDNSTNNTNDLESAKFVYDFLKAEKLTTHFINRYGVMEMPVGWTYFEKLKATNTLLGKHIYEIQKIAFTNLLVGLLGGESLKRQTPEWFFETFTDIPTSEFETWKERINGNDKENAISQVANRIVRFNMYDPLALIVCIDEYKQYFTVERFDNFSIYKPQDKEAIYKLFNSLINLK